MNAKRIFRLLILCSWVAPLVAYLASISVGLRSTGYSGIGITTLSAIHSEPSSTAYWVTLSMLATFIISLTISVGLWCFAPWARLAYLPFGAFYVYWSVFGMPPPRLLPAVADLATFITYAAQGAVAAMAFLPPVSPLFNRARPNHAMELTETRRTTSFP